MSTVTDQSNEKAEKEQKKSFKSRLKAAWKEARSYETKKMKNYLGTTGIWLLSYYVSSILIMIAMNIARVGWSAEAIFAAPAYFAQLFINFGLNAGKTGEFSYEKIEFNRALISASWIFAPIIIYVLGMMMSFLIGSGYPKPTGDYDYLENFYYFHERTVALNSDKSGGFYFFLVWLPLIISILIAAFISTRIYDKERRNDVNVFGLIFLNLLFGYIVGLQMGVMTGTYRFYIGGFFKTIFTNNRNNTGITFNGQYHPHSILIVSWFINLIPIFLVALWFAIYDSIEKQIIRLAEWSGRTSVYLWTKIANFFKNLSAKIKKPSKDKS
ncbi:MAG: hypothetical protein U9O98_01800 [Asgard group archaeon]|nr:hypothetical protein [Asgard group archaeon]